MAEKEPLYATAANFGSNDEEQQLFKRPWVKEVTVPESIKRKYPSKHYVYKVVVKWTNGTETVIYRRYSLFFDFVVKLQELVSKLRKIDVRLEETDLELPELPSKSLFTRGQTHQVAEKRRRKVEEFCQQLILLPPEISESGLVLGFFNIWPDDTLLRNHSQGLKHVISAPVLVPNTSDSPPPLLRDNDCTSSINGVISSTSPPTVPPTSPPTVPPPSPPTAPSMSEPPSTTGADTTSNSNDAMDSIIAHPDEMEHLEQYRVLGNYEAKDSHQVDLFTGQLVHVIEKHDTGWWMVMSEDEQGYAPAAYLEPMDGSIQEDDVHTNSDEVYEAMEEYVPVSDDEVGFKVQDRIKVIAKSMDGWWKIRCNGKTGFAPAALIRPVQTDSKENNYGFESERTIYEEMNIHHAPPRRNTLDRSVINRVPPGYLSPRSHPELANVMEENIYCDPAEESDEDKENIYCDPAEELSEEDEHVYKVPRLSTDQPPAAVPRRSASKDSVFSQSGSESSSVHSVRRGSDGVPHGYDSVRRGSDGVPHGYEIVRRGSDGVAGSHVSVRKGSSSSRRSKSTSVSPPPQESDEREGSAENLRQEAKKKSHPPPISQKPRVSPKPIPPPPPAKPKPKMDASEHNKYVSMKGPSEPRPPDSSGKKKPLPVVPQHSVDDYEDLDLLEEPQSDLIPALDDYVDMSGPSPLEDLKRSDELVKASPTKVKAPEPPPRVSNKPTPTKLGPVKSFSIDPELPVFEEDVYEEMDAKTTNKSPPPPTEARMFSPPLRNSPKGKNSKPPPPPAPYSPKAGGKRGLTRAKSMEDILSPSRDSPDIGRKQYSPPLLKKDSFAPPLPARNPPQSKPSQPAEKDVSFLPIKPDKPKPGKTRNPFKRNKQPQLANGHSSTEPNDPHPSPKPKPGRTGPERSISPIARHSISPPGIREKSPHPPLIHTNSEPFIDVVEKKKTFWVAVFSFGGPSDRCLSFSAGDKCELVKRNEETGWWLVKIGEKVGWTPGEYWKELPSNSRDRSVTNAPLPTVPAPPVARKPRSHTVADIGTTPGYPELLKSSIGLTSSGEGEMSPLTDSGRYQSSGGKAKGISPQKPKPVPESGSPLASRKPKPALPQKYGSASSVPAGLRGEGSPTPPPLPPANSTRRLGSHSSVAEVGSSPKTPPIPPPKPAAALDGEEYVMLDEVSTIEKAAWFVGKMERVQAESFLMENGRQREFLVRERTNKDGYYALSVRYHYNIRHFNIDPTPDGQYAMGTLVFPSIDEIIRHYQINSLFIHDSQHVTLGQAVTKKRSRLAEGSKMNGV